MSGTVFKVRRIVQLPSSAQWTWISDDLLEDAYNRFVSACIARNKLQYRQCARHSSYASNLFEARRRLAGRRMNHLAINASANPGPVFDPTVFLDDLWGRPAQPSWRWERPSEPQPRSRISPPIPSWLLKLPPPPPPGPSRVVDSEYSLQEAPIQEEEAHRLTLSNRLNILRTAADLPLVFESLKAKEISRDEAKQLNLILGNILKYDYASWNQILDMIHNLPSIHMALDVTDGSQAHYGKIITRILTHVHEDNGLGTVLDASIDIVDAARRSGDCGMMLATAGSIGKYLRLSFYEDQTLLGAKFMTAKALFGLIHDIGTKEDANSLLKIYTEILDSIVDRSEFLPRVEVADCLKLLLSHLNAIPTSPIVLHLMSRVICLGRVTDSALVVQSLHNALLHDEEEQAGAVQGSSKTVVRLLDQMPSDLCCQILETVPEYLTSTLSEVSEPTNLRTVERWYHTMRSSNAWRQQIEWRKRMRSILAEKLLTIIRPSEAPFLLESLHPQEMCFRILQYWTMPLHFANLRTQNKRSTESQESLWQPMYLELSQKFGSILLQHGAKPRTQESSQIEPNRPPDDSGPTWKLRGRGMRELTKLCNPVYRPEIKAGKPFLAAIETLKDHRLPMAQIQDTFEEMLSVLAVLGSVTQIDALLRGVRRIIEVRPSESLHALLSAYIGRTAQRRPMYALRAFNFDQTLPLSRAPGLIRGLIASHQSLAHPKDIFRALLSDRGQSCGLENGNRGAGSELQPICKLSDTQISEIHDAALAFSRASRISSRTAWTSVMQLWEYLNTNNAPLDSRMSRAMVAAGVLRPIHNGTLWKSPRKTFRFIREVVKELEGEIVADRLDQQVLAAEKGEWARLRDLARKERKQRYKLCMVPYKPVGEQEGNSTLRHPPREGGDRRETKEPLSWRERMHERERRSSKAHRRSLKQDWTLPLEGYRYI